MQKSFYKDVPGFQKQCVCLKKKADFNSIIPSQFILIIAQSLAHAFKKNVQFRKLPMV